MTQKNQVLKILREKGQIDNYYCIDNRLTIRLGAIIHELVKEGKIVVDDDKSGFIEGTKNWKYVIKPVKIEEIYSNGVKIAERYI